MAIPIARVHLAMAHAALPGLLPSPPKCMMLPLLPAPPCAAIVVLPNNSSPPWPNRADAAERWDAHKIKQAGGSPASPPPTSSASQCSLDSKSRSPGRASLSDKWVSNNKKSASAATSSTSSSSSSGSSRADSEERWDANKKLSSTATSSLSSAGKNKRRDVRSKRRPNSRVSSSSSVERWDAHKNGRRAPPADELDDGESSSTGSNDVELDKAPHQTPPLKPMRRALYAGPGFIASPEPCMLPMPPSFMICVA